MKAAQNPLARYLSEKGITQDEFARSVDLTQATVSKLINGRTGISLATATKIEAATGGEVKAVYWHYSRLPSGAPHGAGQ